MKNINEQALNEVTVIGKLIEVKTTSTTNQNGQPAEYGSAIIRVTQTYSGNEEISEVPVSFYITKFKSNGKDINPAYKSLQELKEMKTAAAHGIEGADIVKVTRASIAENVFVPKGTTSVVYGSTIRGNFFNKGNTNQVASFNTEIYIMDIKEELDKDGEETGRLLITGGVVQYGGNLDVITYVVEHPTYVDYISRNWNVDDTVKVSGYIRYTTKNVEKVTESSWGELIPETTTQKVHEYVIVNGSNEAYDEDFAYDKNDIKKAFNVRKAKIEQKLENAKGTPKESADWRSSMNFR